MVLKELVSAFATLCWLTLRRAVPDDGVKLDSNSGKHGWRHSLGWRQNWLVDWC